MKKLILTTATVLFIGLITFAYESGKWTKKNDKCVIQKANVKNDTDSKKQDKGKYTGSIKWPNAALHIIDIPQELQYDIHARYSRPIKKDQLNGVKLISDIIPGYPANWITSYVSVEISGTCDGRDMKAVSLNDVLSEEQKNIINAIDLGTDIVIDVKYTYKVPVTNVIENNVMHVSMTLVPEAEAEYIGGHAQMINYFKEDMNKFSKITPKQLQQVTIRFTINEEGLVTDAKIYKASGDPKTYNVLLDAIYKMPKWKPAENAKGIKVKQAFEFTVGNNSGC